MLSVMRRYRDNRNHSSIRSIIPENPVSTRCFLLGICIEDLFPLRPFERSKFAGVQRRMAEVGFKKPKTFPDGLEDSLFRRVVFNLSKVSVGSGFFDASRAENLLGQILNAFWGIFYREWFS